MKRLLLETLIDSRSKLEGETLFFMEFKKANKITAISAVVIVIGFVYAIVNSKIEDQQQQRVTEFQYRQKFSRTNEFCREEAGGGNYRYLLNLGMRKDAKEYLMKCMEKNGFWNVNCGSFGVCKLDK
tara:strand:+ start:195 stop:575 length:381 start_codon:yes stop_codon:yes gene_type:complete